MGVLRCSSPVAGSAAQFNSSVSAMFSLAATPRAMNVLEISGECSTFDSAFIRGWRWLFSAQYRDEIRARCTEHHWALVTLGVLETMLLMLAEIVALVFLAKWLVGL